MEATYQVLSIKACLHDNNMVIVYDNNMVIVYDNNMVIVYVLPEADSTSGLGEFPHPVQPTQMITTNLYNTNQAAYNNQSLECVCPHHRTQTALQIII